MNQNMKLEAYLQRKIADETDMSVEDIPLDQEFDQLDLDSLSILTIAFDLETDFGFDNLDPTVLSEFNTINKLVEWMTSKK